MSDIGKVRGLFDLWSALTGRSGNSRSVPVRPLLDTLGLGLEQVMTRLGRERPDWEEFVAWAAATVGNGDEAALARYEARLSGKAPPPAQQARQAAVLAMRPVFSDDEMAAWLRDGVIILREAITLEEAGAIAEHLWRTKGATPEDPATWYDGPRGNGIMIQEFQNPAMDVPRRSPRVHRAFAQLYGHADLLVSTDRLSFNPPETAIYAFPGPELHWDVSLAHPIPFETQGLLYLTDTNGDQGALRLVPGFHHRITAGWLDALEGRDPRRIDLAGEAVPIAANAGDLVIWRQELPHGASANTSQRPRMVQYVTMYPMRKTDTRRWL